MSELYQSLSHSKWDCKYHVVFVPKRRRKAIFGQTRRQQGRFSTPWPSRKSARLSKGASCQTTKHPVASVIGFLKGKSAIAIARLCGKERDFTGEHFWARGYAVSTVAQAGAFQTAGAAGPSDTNPRRRSRGQWTQKQALLISSPRWVIEDSEPGALEQSRGDLISLEYEMAGVDRVTVTLPNDLVRDIDRREKNRSKFVAEAIRNELDRRRRAELRRSLDNPHPESAELAGQGLEEWTRGLPQEDAEALVDSNAGKPVRWVSGEGWVEGRE